MNEYEAKELMFQLTQNLKKWSRAYYTEDRPTVSDDVYNAAFEQLQLLESQYPQWVDPSSPTQRVGDALKSGLPKGRHPTPMVSINTHRLKVAGAGEYFHNTVTKQLGMTTGTSDLEYCLEPKYDGLAIELVYYQNQLVQALTRGDGIIGESVYHNVRLVQNVPHRFAMPMDPPPIAEVDSSLHFTYVRGEIFFPRWSFKQYKEEMDQKGVTVPSNERNSAAGLIRRIDTSDLTSRLKFYPYEIQTKGGDRKSVV